MARILVIGCGRLGLPYALEMAARGHQVTGLRRSIAEDADPRIQWIAADVTDPASISHLPIAFDLITIILTPQSRSPRGYQQIYQDGLDIVLSRLADAQTRPRLNFVSATSVYAQNHGEWVDEDSETVPETYNGRSLLDAERAIHRFGSANVVIRFSGIYGPDRRRLLTSLQQPLEVQAKPSWYTNRIHQSDCVGVLSFVSDRLLAGQPVPAILCASDGDPAPKAEVMVWLAQAAGLVAPTLVDATDSPAKQNKRVRNDRLLALGYRLRYPGYQNGYREMLEQTEEIRTD